MRSSLSYCIVLLLAAIVVSLFALVSFATTAADATTTAVNQPLANIAWDLARARF